VQLGRNVGNWKRPVSHNFFIRRSRISSDADQPCADGTGNETIDPVLIWNFWRLRRPNSLLQRNKRRGSLNKDLAG